MAISKVIFGDQTLIDITDTDASASNVYVGKKFYDAAGNLITGTAEVTVDGTKLIMPIGLINVEGETL